MFGKQLRRAAPRDESLAVGIDAETSGVGTILEPNYADHYEPTPSSELAALAAVDSIVSTANQQI